MGNKGYIGQTFGIYWAKTMEYIEQKPWDIFMGYIGQNFGI